MDHPKLSPEALELLRDALLEDPPVDVDDSFVIVDRVAQQDIVVRVPPKSGPDLESYVFILVTCGYYYFLYTCLPIGVFNGTGRALWGLSRHMLLVHTGVPVGFGVLI